MLLFYLALCFPHIYGIIYTITFIYRLNCGERLQLLHWEVLLIATGQGSFTNWNLIQWTIVPRKGKRFAASLSIRATSIESEGSLKAFFLLRANCFKNNRDCFVESKMFFVEGCILS